MSPPKYLQGILRTYRRICNSSFPTHNFYVSKYKGINDCIKEKMTILFKIKNHCRISKIYSCFQKKSHWSYFNINQKNFSRSPAWMKIFCRELSPEQLAETVFYLSDMKFLKKFILSESSELL